MKADKDFLAKKQTLRDLGAAVKSRAIPVVENAGIMKGIAYVKPSPDESTRYVGLSEDYLVVMHFNDVVSAKLSQGFEFNDDLIEQAFSDFTYNKNKN